MRLGHGSPTVCKMGGSTRRENNPLLYLLWTIVAADHCRTAQASTSSGTMMVQIIIRILRNNANDLLRGGHVRMNGHPSADDDR